MYDNPYFNQQQRFQNIPNQQYIPPMQQPMTTIPPMNTQVGLQGKVVESIDVVKAMDIPLDGSASYFVISDGSAIVSKQLQNDGTSKMVVYKPSQEEKKEIIEFATLDELQDVLSDLQDLKDEMKEIKKQFKEFKPKKNKEDD